MDATDIEIYRENHNKVWDQQFFEQQLKKQNESLVEELMNGQMGEELKNCNVYKAEVFKKKESFASRCNRFFKKVLNTFS